MSSLQKFHRRTQSLGPATWPATAIGGGDNIYGFWLGDISSNKLVVAPKSTEASLVWGSYNVTRTTNNTSNGLVNTNTLAGFGQAAHPAAYYCKNLTTGGYNTWYLPAKDELMTMYSNKSATPFATANSCDAATAYWSSTEVSATGAWKQNLTTGQQYSTALVSKNGGYPCRAVRRTAI